MSLYSELEVIYQELVLKLDDERIYLVSFPLEDVGVRELSNAVLIRMCLLELGIKLLDLADCFLDNAVVLSAGDGLGGLSGRCWDGINLLLNKMFYLFL